jgi:tRNA pseudouridine55 synthase
MVEQRRDGFAVVDKPAGWTSHDVVAKVRKVLGNRKVGHSGTLDPDATGILLLGIGRGTRLLRFLTPLRKVYSGEMVLGVETSTLDAAGEVTATHDMSTVRAAQVSAAAAEFVGAIEQIPPMVSAVKVDGKRLHELARRGEEVERAPRPVTVYSLATTQLTEGVYQLDVECSSGTYVRTLAADIGSALGGGAHLRALRRTAIGAFSLDQATTIEGVIVRPMADAVADYPSVRVEADLRAAIGHGKVLRRDDLGVDGDGPWAVLDGDGELLAMYEARGDAVKPAVVVIPA